MPTPSRMPALFIEHGSPYALDDLEWQADLHRVAQSMPKPRSILIISAHWREPGFAIGATETIPLLYDFYGFPEHMYQVRYPAPEAPDLADRVAELLGAAFHEEDGLRRTVRGLDHGAFIPLMAMYPEADIPVLQLAIPGSRPQVMLEMGQALAPLREEGVLILGAGYLIHNLSLVKFESHTANPPTWVREFDAWVEDALNRGDNEALLDFRRQAPHCMTALPTDEHFVPLFIPLGASSPEEEVTYPIRGFSLGSFTRRSIRWG